MSWMLHRKPLRPGEYIRDADGQIARVERVTRTSIFTRRHAVAYYHQVVRWTEKEFFARKWWRTTVRSRKTDRDMTGLCKKTIRSIRSGQVGFNIGTWFDTTGRYEHELSEVEMPGRCGTVGCLAAHIVLASGAKPTKDPDVCVLEGEKLYWEEAAACLWLDAYPGTDEDRLSRAFDPLEWDDAPTLDALEHLLRQLAGKERVAPVDGFDLDVGSD